VNLPSYATSTVYYRLRQVDISGNTKYSPVRTLSATQILSSAIEGLQVYPNPALGTDLVVVSGCQSSSVQLLDMNGKLHANASVAADGTAELPISNLPAGTYLLRCGLQHAKLLLTK
jgi:hypothetical protein